MIKQHILFDLFGSPSFWSENFQQVSHGIDLPWPGPWGRTQEMMGYKTTSVIIVAWELIVFRVYYIGLWIVYYIVLFSNMNSILGFFHPVHCICLSFELWRRMRLGVQHSVGNFKRPENCRKLRREQVLWRQAGQTFGAMFYEFLYEFMCSSNSCFQDRIYRYVEATPLGLEPLNLASLQASRLRNLVQSMSERTGAKQLVTVLFLK